MLNKGYQRVIDKIYSLLRVPIIAEFLIEHFENEWKKIK